jgi:hypothetical protein
MGIEALGILAVAVRRLERRNHDGIEAARQDIVLQGDQERLALAAAREWICEQVELFHRRLQKAGIVGQQAMLGDPAIVLRNRLLIVLQPLLFELGPHQAAQPPLQRLGQVYAHAARMVEQFRIDEQVDGALPRRPVADHGGGL